MSLAYAEAGVSIDTANRFEEMIKERVAAAWPLAADQIGRFAGRGSIPPKVTRFCGAADGTGTKALLAALADRFDGIGKDGVAMAAVDAYVNGDMPSAIFDVLDVGQLIPDKHIQIIDSLIAGCKQVGPHCHLLGGETAELPGMFKHPWMMNLNVFAVGFALPELEYIPVQPGQLVYGWPSHGPASNGFSLLRKVFGLDGKPSVARARLERRWPELGETLADALLRPTPIWINQLEIQRIDHGVKFAGHAHITGGGLLENIPRILPSTCKVVIDNSAWVRPPIFQLVEDYGSVSSDETDRILNQGIMVVSIVDQDGQQPDTPNCFLIGEVMKRTGDEPQVVLHDPDDI